jgi:hypothetical protein
MWFRPAKNIEMRSGAGLRLSCRVSGDCGGGLGLCVIRFQLIQWNPIREFFDCIQPAKYPQHAEMDGFRAAPAFGKDLAFEQGHLNGEAMWAVGHFVNATGGNGCASSETVCFTIHGILQKIGVSDYCV